ncbi:MAG: fumarate hydratase [Clostridia bacterium]|nr:fumarate hydratase [Clostridia bacterium]
MIRKETLESAVFDAIRRGTTILPEDVKSAFERAICKETSKTARFGLEKTLESMNLSKQRDNLLCADTGWPIFYVKVGEECVVEGGFTEIEKIIKEQVAKATHAGYLRKTMKHPLTGADPGNNIGMNIPGITYKLVKGNELEIAYVAKGGGSECFGGTRHRMVAFADGIAGIKKCVIENFIAASKAGAICPPSVLGIGIGGTANMAANLAKEAACLRTVGSHHPETDIRNLEIELCEAINELGVGILGAGGKVSVLAVNIEYAYTHIAGIAVAMSSNCMVARRGANLIKADNTIIPLKAPNWFDREEN